MSKSRFKNIRLVVRERSLDDVKKLADKELHALNLPPIRDNENVDLQIGWMKSKDAIKQAHGFQFTIFGVALAFTLYGIAATITAGTDGSWGSFAGYLVLTVGSAILCYIILGADDISPHEDSIIGTTVAMHIADHRPRPLDQLPPASDGDSSPTAPATTSGDTDAIANPECKEAPPRDP